MASSAASVQNQAWVTLATNDSYALGALVLGNSLRRSGTMRKSVIMVTRTVSLAMQEQLRRTFDEVVDVAELDSGDFANLALLERPELGITFTKLHCWKLTDYAKCVFLDADTLVLRNCDELFDRDEFSAAPDAGWPDCFNSGVFVFKPSVDTFKALIQHAQTQGSFDGGDQGLLNTFFSDWPTKDIGKHLSFLYNMCATATYTYLPAYRFYGQNVRIIHFIGASKPWHVQFDPVGQPQPRTGEEHTVDHLKHWWQIFHSDVKPNLESVLQKLVPSPSPYSPEGGYVAGGGSHQFQGPEGPSVMGHSMAALQDRRERWEEGRPDYMGSASFDNILKKISSTMNTPEASPHTSREDLRPSSLPDLEHYYQTRHHEPENQLVIHHVLERSRSQQDVRDYTPFEAEPPPDPWLLNRAQWERGHPDYLGMNAFDNIKAKLDWHLREDHGYATGHSAGEESPQKSLQQQQPQELQEQEPNEPPQQQPLPPDDRSSWEVGHPDYLGKASFDNILRRIETNMGEPVVRPKKQPIVVLPVKEKKKKKRRKSSRLKKTREDSEEEEGVISSSTVTRSTTAPPSTASSSTAQRGIVIRCPCCGFDQEVPEEQIRAILPTFS